MWVFSWVSPVCSCWSASTLNSLLGFFFCQRVLSALVFILLLNDVYDFLQLIFFLFSLPQPVLPMIPLGILQAVAKLTSFLLNVQQGDANTPISCYHLPLKVPDSLKCKVLCFVGQSFHWTLCREAEAVKWANSVHWKPELLYFCMSLESSHLDFCIFLSLSVFPQFYCNGSWGCIRKWGGGCSSVKANPRPVDSEISTEYYLAGAGC